MSYFEVLKKIKADEVTPIILIYGTESFFIQSLKEELIKVLVDNEENISNYDLEETPIEEVIADAETYPFFGEKKLIIANNPVFLRAKPARLPFEHNIDRLEQYIKNPVDYSTIVFIAPYENIDNRKKITKMIRKSALVAACDEIKEHEIEKWIHNLAQSLQINIAKDAYDVFISELNLNLHLIQNELIKMAIYVGENGEITKSIAENLIAKTVNSSALRLVDAVIEQNLHKAISILKDLEKMNEEPIALLALLAYQFRTILQVKLLKLKGYSQFQIQKQLGLHPYVVKIAHNRERLFSISQLEEIMNKLTHTDAVMKQGTMEKGLAFELLLYGIIHK